MPLTNDQVYSLVGRFLHDWAMMESALNNAIQTILQLDPLQGIIVCSNIPFFNKTHILTTAVDQARFDDEKTKKFKKTIQDIRDLSYERNIVAHDLFMATDDGNAVKFLVTKAKGSLKFPETIWTPQDFEQRSSRLFGFISLLDEIGLETRKSNQNLQVLTKALMAHDCPQAPIPSNFVPGSLGFRFPQPPKPRNLANRLATSQKDHKTPPSSEE